MFPSISRALPNTQVTTLFRATTSLVLVLPVQDANGNPFNITINNGAVQTGQVPGSIATTWTVSAAAGDLITAIVTSPFNNLEHVFFEYTANGVYQNFAVVCESLYTIKVIPADARKRWYDYSYTTAPAYSFRQSNGVITVPVVTTSRGSITVNSHVVMNPATKSVYFYDSITGIQTSVIVFSSPPIDYQILTSRNKIVVLTRSGDWYEVDMASVVTPLPALDTTARCLGYDNTTSTMWVGGATVCWAYTPGPAGGMSLLGICAVTEQIVGIAPVPNLATSAVAVSVNNNGFILSTAVPAAPLSSIPSTAIGQPVAFGNYIYIPDGNNAQLLAYNYTTSMFDLAVQTIGYSPKYTLVRNGNLYVTNNDSPDVLVFDSVMNMTKLVFRDKVTLISASGATAVASHFLDTVSTTLAPSLTRIVDVTFDNRSGPITHIGSNSVKIITVGYQIVTGYTAGRTVLWVSGVKTDSAGVRGYDIINGSTVNISYRVSTPGTSQVAAVIGDSAFDYQVTAFVETYYPRYIDFLIGDSNNPSYTQTLTMPNKMTPATMAIEYGDLKLNGIAYDGSTKVFANDVITITITLGNPYGYGKGMLPIFSLGARQFAIPISADPVPVVTTVISDNNLSPNTALSKTQTITGNVSLYDFILPDYYNVKILKRMTAYSIPGVPPIVNDVDVSGNYYQPFGSGDILVVNYNSSVKLYDTEVVYILGPVNYKFTANNRLPFLINYLDYGTLSNPYTRDFEPLTSGFGNSIMGSSGAITYVPETAHATDMQVVTANLQIVGYITTAGNAVLKLTGGDAQIIINGDTAVGSNVTLINPVGNSEVITNAVTVYNGDQVAIGRNVQSYFDGNIQVIQNMLDIENDFVSIEVGKWRIVNQTVKNAVFQTQETSAIINRIPVADTTDSTVFGVEYAAGASTTNLSSMTYAADVHNLIVGTPYLVSPGSPTTAAGMSALQWLQETVMIPQAATLQWMQETTMVPASSILQWLQETMMIPKPTTLQWLQATTMVPAAGVLRWLQATTMVPSSSVLQWLQETTMVPDSGIIQWLQATTMVPAASVREWLQETTMTPKSSTHEWLQETTMTPKSSTHEWLQETTMAPKSSSNEWLQETTMAPNASVREWLQATTMTPKSSTNEWLQETTKTPAASHMELTQETTKTPNASHHALEHDTARAIGASTQEWFQETTKTPAASLKELAQDTAVVVTASPVDMGHDHDFTPAASQHNLVHDTVYNIPASPVDMGHDHDFTPAASQHNLVHDTVYNVPASKKELYHDAEFLVSTSMIAPEIWKPRLQPAAPTEWNNLIVLPLPTSTVTLSHLPVEEIYLNSPAIEHSDYIDKLSMPWIREVLAKSIEHTVSPSIYSRYFLLSNAYDFNIFYDEFINSHTEWNRSFFAPETLLDTIPRFVGEHYTPINRVFDRSTDARLILMPMSPDRNPYLNYDYENTIFDRESVPPIELGVNYSLEPSIRYIPLNEQFVRESLQDIVYDRTFVKELYADTKLTADYKIADNLGDLITPANYNLAKFGKDIQLAADYNRSAEDNKIALDVNYQFELADHTIVLDGDYEAENNSLSFQVKPEYQQIINTLSFQVKPEYQQIIDHLSFQVKADYEPSIDHLSFQVKADYEQDLPVSIYGNATKLTYQVDPELLWKQDLSTDYFVFNTAQDALDKALNDGYTNYAAYQVYGTQYYSYRILIDTALVCKLPKGRYPIAWLLHGG